MSVGRRALVYGVAAIVGFLFAFLLLPRGIEGDSGLTESSGEEPVERGAVARSNLDQDPSDTPERTETVEAGTPGEPRVGRGGNPKALKIAEALSTPAHELVGRTSPVWVQVRRVLPQGNEWLDLHTEVDAMLDSLRAAARDTQLELHDLLAAQYDLVARLEREDLGEAVAEALEELSSRLRLAEAG